MTLPPGAGIDGQLHRHPDAQPRRVGLGEPRLDAHLARQLDVADAVGLEGAVGHVRGGLGSKHWIVQVHSVPRVASRYSRTSTDVQRGQDAWRGNVTVSQRAQREPISRGSAVMTAGSRRLRASKASAGERATM